MGTFVDFKCGYCKYEENHIGVGHGSNPSPRLALFRCPSCKTVGSTWVYPDRDPVCAHCYHEDIEILDAGARTVTCPKCGEPGHFTDADGEWM